MDSSVEHPKLEKESEIQGFYKNKTIFITGGTGFLGKVVIEKLLRTTEVARIYFLIRSKRSQDIEQRMTLWRQDALFEVLLKNKPQALERVHPITGDCLEPDLGLSESDRALLISQVQLVFHGAATVRFTEPLHVALATNTRATQSMMQLAKQMSQLEAFMHISTAFSNCMLDQVKEEFYPEQLSCNSEQVLAISEQVSDELLDNMEPALLGKFPNTYTYTKALAEDAVLRIGSDLPVCIFRPAVIIATFKDPVAGWIDNLYGPIAITYGVAHGVLRVCLLDTKAHISVVPVDYCANVIMAALRKTAQDSIQRKEQQQLPPIYNFASSDENVLTYGDFRDKALQFGLNYPLTKMLWYPFLHCMTTRWLFPFVAFFYHLLPGYLIDFALLVSGNKPRLVKVYQRIHKTIIALEPFSRRTYHFDMQNTNRLWQDMTPRDREIYNFDMNRLDWNEYFQNGMRGMRLYLGNEPSTAASLLQGQKLLQRFLIMHRLLQFLLGCMAAFLLWWFLKPLVYFFETRNQFKLGLVPN